MIGDSTAAMFAAMGLYWRKDLHAIYFRQLGCTSAMRGCDPKQMLIRAASVLDHVRRMHGKGLTGDNNIGRTELMAFKRMSPDPVLEKTSSGMPKNASIPTAGAPT